MYLIVLLFLLFASVFSLQKQSLLYSEPIFSIGFRMFLAGFLLLIFCIFFINKKKFIVNFKHIYLFILLSLFGIYLTNVCEILGMVAMESSKACLIYSLSPFITALFSFFFLKESLNSRQLIGLVFGFLSIIPLSVVKTLFEKQSILIASLSLYEMYLLFAVLFSVIGWFLLKKIISLNYSILIINSYSMLLGGSFSLIHSYLLHKNLLIYNFKYFILYSIIICFISNFFCYNFFGFLLKKYSITLLTFTGLLTPIFSKTFGYFFLNESLSYYFFFSFLLIIIGLYFFYYKK